MCPVYPVQWSTKLSHMFSESPLPLLEPHLPVLLGSAALFWAVQLGTHGLAPRIPGRLGEKWKSWDSRTRKGFASHVASQVHAVVAIPLAIKSLQSTILAKDPVFGYDPFVGNALAYSAGYFIWDTIDSLLNSTIGFVVHGAACLAVYLFSFRPFLAGFGPCFLLWELSTPLLNAHWFMDKLELSTEYPTLFLINAIGFMGTFFLARIVYGGYNSVQFFTTMYRERERIPWYLHLIYCSGNLALNALNCIWFSKMFAKMLARLNGDESPKAPGAGQKKRRVSGAANKRSSAGKALNETAPLLEKDGEMEAVSEEDEGITLPAQPPRPVAQQKGEL